MLIASTTASSSNSSDDFDEGAFVGEGTYSIVHTAITKDIKHQPQENRYVVKTEKEQKDGFSQAAVYANEAHFSQIYLKHLGDTTLIGDLIRNDQPRKIRQPRIKGTKLSEYPITTTEQLFAVCIAVFKTLETMHAEKDADGNKKGSHVYGDVSVSNFIIEETMDDQIIAHPCDFGLMREKGELTSGTRASYQPERLKDKIPAHPDQDIESVPAIVEHFKLSAKGLAETCKLMREGKGPRTATECIAHFETLEAINYFIAHQEDFSNPFMAEMHIKRMEHFKRGMTNFTDLRTNLSLFDKQLDHPILQHLGRSFLIQLLFADPTGLSKIFPTFSTESAAYLLKHMATLIADADRKEEDKKIILAQLKLCIDSLDTLIELLQTLTKNNQKQLVEQLGLDFIKTLVEKNPRQLLTILNMLPLIEAQDLFARLNLDNVQLRQFSQAVYDDAGKQFKMALACIDKYCYNDPEKYHRAIVAFNQQVYLGHIKTQISTRFFTRSYVAKQRYAETLNDLKSTADLERHKVQLGSGCCISSSGSGKLQDLTTRFIEVTGRMRR